MKIERVLHRTSGLICEVLSRDQGYYWLKLPDGRELYCYAGECSRVDDERPGNQSGQLYQGFLEW